MLNRSFHPLRLCALLLLLATGCASYTWHKDGATAAETQDLLAQCTAKARAEILRDPALAARPPVVTVDREGRVIAVQSPRNDSERFLLEQDLVRRCMSAGGYTLRPSPKTAP